MDRPRISDLLMNQTIVPQQPGPEYGVRMRLPGSPNMMGEAAKPDRGMSAYDRFTSVGTPAGGMEMAANIIGGPALRGIRAFHVSPHKYDKPDLSKIGTGEGAQSYGHGLYGAESPGTRDSYWEAFAAKMGLQKGTPEYLAARLNLESEGNISAAVANLPRQPVPPSVRAEAGKILKSGEVPGPTTYEWNIRANPEQFLDWEKPFAQQSPGVQRAVTNVLGAPPPPKSSDMARGYDIYDQVINRGLDPSPTIYRPDNVLWQQQRAKRPVASQMLNEAGVPGIKYRDQFSRRDLDLQNVIEMNMDPARVAQAKAELASRPPSTNNYVVFDDKIIDILKRYGLMGGAVSSPMAAALMQNGEQ